MRTELRLLLAIGMMIGVLVITNLLFPPVPPPEVQLPPEADTTRVEETQVEAPVQDTPFAPAIPEIGVGETPAIPSQEVAEEPAGLVEEDVLGERQVVVEGPLYRFTFSNVGGRLLSARLLEFPSATREGAVELLHPEAGGALGSRLLIGQDTLDLASLLFEVEPEGGVRLEEGGPSETLRFVYRHPTHPFTYEVRYTFHPDQYIVDVHGQVEGVDADVLFTDLGTGLPFNEQRAQDEARASAYVVNHIQEGIRAFPLSRVSETVINEGPLLWTAFKSKYFLLAMLAGSGETEGGDEEAYLGGVIAREVPEENQAALTASQTVGSSGEVAFRVFMGPQEFARLSGFGADLEDVNPYGWKFFRPIVRPFVGIIMTILVFLHERLSLGYGWVLILFGVMMRIVLFPLNQKAMRAQLRNMAVQPLMKEIQAKYKDNPEKLQKEMMKLYKEHGFNPVAGCLPMLLPWPVLIALFFVFQNTIELRGVSFLWLPDLSAPDPVYVLPVLLAVSMFLLQWVSLRSMPDQNPQMKMMMYVLPGMMFFIFFGLASGLNLYYATANLATLPQQIWIAGERKKAQAKMPVSSPK
ncbi:membrane protein insertase YidC [Gemmatimonadota bacterium]